LRNLLIKLGLLSLPVCLLLQSTAAHTATADEVPPAAKPNILFLVADDQTYRSLPAMRHLMSFPGGSWVNFTNAFANNSVCCPARATLFTGQYSHNHHVINNETGANLDDTNTVATWLHKQGYANALLGKYLNGFPWGGDRTYMPPGWDYFPQPKDGKRADLITNDAIRYLERTISPFFLYVSFNEPHTPARPDPEYVDADVYMPPLAANFNEADVLDKPKWVRRLPILTPAQIDTIAIDRIGSHRELLSMDDGILALFNYLQSSGRLDTTVIVFVSDNGYSWGEHRWLKKPCTYEECIHVPLLIRYPGLEGNREETRMVSHADIASTLAEIAGATPELPQDGRSLVPLLENTADTWPTDVFLETFAGPLKSAQGIRSTDWKYVEYANGDKELYDLIHDPYELENLAKKPAYALQMSDYANRLRRLLGQ
jgi:N-acetylglucosamine-6-sulfatase